MPTGRWSLAQKFRRSSWSFFIGKPKAKCSQPNTLSEAELTVLDKGLSFALHSTTPVNSFPVLIKSRNLLGIDCFSSISVTGGGLL